jgi:hypothetical protein
MYYPIELLRKHAYLMLCHNSRFLAGALNGNIGVMKSMLAEITDETNAARAFGIVPLSWAIGNTVGYVSSMLANFCCIHR